MYYRIEGSEYLDNQWSDWCGIANVLCGGENKKAFRGIAVPRCLIRGKYKNTRSWFTDYGWKKYKEQIMQQVESHGMWIRTRTRVLTAESLPNIVMHGKTQVLENLDAK